MQKKDDSIHKSQAQKLEEQTNIAKHWINALLIQNKYNNTIFIYE